MIPIKNKTLGIPMVNAGLDLVENRQRVSSVVASLYEIEIGIVVPAAIYAPVWLADRHGFLRDEGLTVRLRSFGSTDGTTAA